MPILMLVLITVDSRQPVPSLRDTELRVLRGVLSDEEAGVLCDDDPGLLPLPDHEAPQHLSIKRREYDEFLEEKLALPDHRYIEGRLRLPSALLSALQRSPQRLRRFSA